MWHALGPVSYRLILKQEAESYEQLDQGRKYACFLDLTRPATFKEGKYTINPENPEVVQLGRTCSHIWIDNPGHRLHHCDSRVDINLESGAAVKYVSIAFPETFRLRDIVDLPDSHHRVHRWSTR